MVCVLSHLCWLITCWFRPREDLTLDDSRALPEPIAIENELPNHLFGKALAVAEWLTAFGTAIDLKRQVDEKITCVAKTSLFGWEIRFNMPLFGWEI